VKGFYFLNLSLGSRSLSSLWLAGVMIALTSFGLGCSSRAETVEDWNAASSASHAPVPNSPAYISNSSASAPSDPAVSCSGHTDPRWTRISDIYGPIANDQVLEIPQMREFR
jgi:hypothetical protein